MVAHIGRVIGILTDPRGHSLLSGTYNSTKNIDNDHGRARNVRRAKKNRIHGAHSPTHLNLRSPYLCVYVCVGVCVAVRSRRASCFSGGPRRARTKVVKTRPPPPPDSVDIDGGGEVVTVRCRAVFRSLFSRKICLMGVFQSNENKNRCAIKADQCSDQARVKAEVELCADRSGWDNYAD